MTPRRSRPKLPDYRVAQIHWGTGQVGTYIMQVKRGPDGEFLPPVVVQPIHMSDRSPLDARVYLDCELRAYRRALKLPWLMQEQDGRWVEIATGADA